MVARYSARWGVVMKEAPLPLAKLLSVKTQMEVSGWGLVKHGVVWVQGYPFGLLSSSVEVTGFWAVSFSFQRNSFSSAAPMLPRPS